MPVVVKPTPVQIAPPAELIAYLNANDLILHEKVSITEKIEQIQPKLTGKEYRAMLKEQGYDLKEFHGTVAEMSLTKIRVDKRNNRKSPSNRPSERVRKANKTRKANAKRLDALESNVKVIADHILKKPEAPSEVPSAPQEIAVSTA